MLGIVSKGIIIGVLVSAPMGPIGMLCIQRTLNKGRWHGFVTGLGAGRGKFVDGFGFVPGMCNVEFFKFFGYHSVFYIWQLR